MEFYYVLSMALGSCYLINLLLYHYIHSKKTKALFYLNPSRPVLLRNLY